MNPSPESTAILAELRKYLSPRIADLYFQLVFAAVPKVTESSVGKLQPGQLLLQVGKQLKSLRIPRSTLYWCLARLVEIGLIHMTKSGSRTVVTVLAFAHPATTPELVQAPPPPPTRKKTAALKAFAEDHPGMRLSRTLFQFMALRLPSLKEPNFQSWAREADMLLRIDGRTYEEADKVLRWSQKNPFWQRNILSPAKLRAQFDRLQMEMQNDRSATPHQEQLRPRPFVPSAAERRYERLQAAIERFA